MSYTQTERNAIKKKAKELATILGDDFSDLENQSKDMQTDFFKEYSVEANNRVIQKLMDKKIKLTDDKQEPVKTKTFVPAQPQQSQHQEMENN